MKDYKEYVVALKKCAAEHDNDDTSFGSIRVSDLCRDTANLLEEFKQELCEDAISRQATVDFLEKHVESYTAAGIRMGLRVAASLVNNPNYLPTVTPQNQKTAYWILLDECSNSGYYCSKCQKKVVKEGWSDTVKKIKFCPNCGSKMIEPQKSEGKNEQN